MTLVSTIDPVLSTYDSKIVEERKAGTVVVTETENTPEDDALLHRSLTERPDTVICAEGIYLHLESGRKIIDSCGGAAVSLLGHGNEDAMNAAIDQMRKVSYVHTGAFTTPAAEELAHTILGGSDTGLDKALFVGSGSEAMDGAMKLARQFWYEQGQTQRTRFVARVQSYHGSTLGAMSMSSNLPRKIPYEPFQLSNIARVSPAFAYRYQRSDETEFQYAQRLVDEVEATFVHLGPQNIMAFVAETVVGATTGCVAAPKGYFTAIRALCDKYDILLILDEVMCGMGRTGTLFAFEQEGIRPDIVTVGKGLGGGYVPIAGILLGTRIVDVLRQGTGGFNHGHTYQCHPVGCAVALSVQKTLRREGLVERCRTVGQVLEKELRTAFDSCKHVGDIRGRGLFWALEFVFDKMTRKTLDPSLSFSNNLAKRAFELGLAIYPGSGTFDGTHGDHVILAPPYNVTLEQISDIVKILKQAYDDVEIYIHE